MTSTDDFRPNPDHAGTHRPPVESELAFTTPSYLPAVAPAAPMAQAGPYQPALQPVASGLAMKRRNPFAVWLGLPLITLGIYSLVWYYKIHKEMAEFDRRRATSVAGPLLVIFFLGWTVIAPLISYHNTGARIRTAQRAAGLTPSCSPTLSWLLAFVFGLHTLYMQSELNKVVNRYTGAETGATVPLFV